MMVKRAIVDIDEAKCNGCGECIPKCAEGALKIVDGKAKLVSDTYCDGLGVCLKECPQGALTIETREAEEFDLQAAEAHTHGPSPQPSLRPSTGSGCSGVAGAHPAREKAACGCPSARTIDRTRECCEDDSPAPAGTVRSELRQWPVKLYLVNPIAPFFEDADLLVAADCTAFAYGGLHPDFMRGKVVVTGCPKFDDTDLYLEKLTGILSLNDIRTVTVLLMEVPCCTGILRLVQEAVAASGKHVPVESVTISLDGKILQPAAAQ